MFSIIEVKPNKDTLHMLYFVLKGIYFNAKFRPYKTSTLFNRIYYFANSLNRTNHLLYETVEKCLKLFDKKVNVNLSSKTPEVLFWMCLVYPEIAFFRKTKKAILIDDLGNLHAEFLVKTLSNFFNKNNYPFIKIDITTYSPVLSPLNLNNYDILLTTIPTLSVYHNNIILINDYPTYNNFCEIYKAIIS